MKNFAELKYTIDVCLDIIISSKSLWNKHAADVLYLYVKKYYSIHMYSK